jgi:diguanylate cyclase (GGDEF)-like protein/PAS domain S-box-containing protein
VTPVLYNASVYRNEDGDVVGVFAAARDITEATAIADALEKSEKAFRLAIDGAPQGMAVIGLDLEFLQVNPALCALLGHSEAWMLAHGLVDVIPPSELSVALTGNEELVTGAAHMTVHEGQWLRADGSLVWVVHSTALLREPDGTPASYVAHIQDNTDAHKIREDLLDRANHDPLTGLINRDQLQAHIDHLLTLPPQSAGHPAVLFCDIDAFKKVNDTYGHLAGDEVLRVVAHRIAAALRLTDIAARVGGDEFVVVLDAVPEQATAVAVAEKICRAIMQPLSIEGHADTTVTSCVGIVLGSAGIDAHRLMRNADAALYQAKGEGSNRVAIFNSPARSSLAMEIRDSIRAGRFVPHFQPIVTIDDGAGHREIDIKRFAKVEKLQVDLEAASYERDTILFDAINGTGKVGQLLKNRQKQANKDRFRPILMTTFAFIAGMIPLVTAKGVGSGYNRATAGVVVGGQAMSLVLTLVTVPVIYSWFDDLSQFFWRLVGRTPTVVTLPAEPHTAEVGK